MKLEDIGFYTLSDKRARTTSTTSPLQRCELILTDRCNFKCPYCRGMKPKFQGDLDLELAKKIIEYWLEDNLQNIRFSGGEPTLHKGLPELIEMCKKGNVKNIAISTNGSMHPERYLKLHSLGVNDFSISLDSGCCSISDQMSGVKDSWDRVIYNIKMLSEITYVTVGMVFNEINIENCIESVLFADSLGVSDIRIIPSAQYNQALNKLANLPENILNKYPILKYRINNLNSGKHVRGITEDQDFKHCWLMLDDMAVAGKYHFPCIIYFREGGDPVGEVGPNMRQERLEWILSHNVRDDRICKSQCLDVCQKFCQKVKKEQNL